MKKFGLFLFAGLMSLSLAACGSSIEDFIKSNVDETDEDDGNGQDGGTEEVSYEELTEEFENKIESNGFSMVANFNQTDSDTSITYRFGVCDEGFWYATSMNGSFFGSAYKKNGNSYLEYAVDQYGEYSSTPEEVSKESMDSEYESSLLNVEGRLFSYYYYQSVAEVTGDEYYLGRSCVSFNYNVANATTINYTVDDEFKINLKFYTSTLYDGGSTIETNYRISELKTGNSVSFPF